MDDLINIEGDAIHWPFCVIPGCTNRCCLALQSPYCHPHTPKPSFDELMENLNKEPEKELG